MAFIAGIDPGTNGACAVYDTETRRIISMEDMPIWYQPVGKRVRKRIDPVGMMQMFDCLMLLGVELVVLEAVWERPGQRGMFAFGYTYGLTFMSIMYSKIMVETVPPQRWKKLMGVVGKKGKDMDSIMARADAMFPDDRQLFRGKKGGRLVDRAEAAMLAKFGGDYILRTMRPLEDGETFESVYRNAETGA